MDRTVRGFFRARALEAGAGIAYYAFFSLFPTLIFLVSLLGFFLKPEQVNAQVMKLLQDFFPVSKDEIIPLIKQTLQTVIERRGSVSIVAGVSLLWAGSNVFTVVVRNINRAWGTTSNPLNFLQTRMMAMAIIFALAAFILLSLLSMPILNLLARFEIGDLAVYKTPVWWALSFSLPHFFTFLFFFALYRWVPNTRVPWRPAALGGLVATVAWQSSIFGFTWAIQEGVVNYQLIYGSLTTIVIAMFWIYLSSLILLFGAHLSANLGHAKDEGL